MTENNRKENIHAELNRADDAIKAADLLFDHSFVSDAVSRIPSPVKNKAKITG